MEIRRNRTKRDTSRHHFGLLIAATVVITLAFACVTVNAGEYTGVGPLNKIKGPPQLIGGAVKFRVDKSNVETYKDKLPVGLYTQIKEWGRVIVVYDTVSDYKPPAEFQDATEKYRGSAKITAQGGIENYTAGLPFPDPKTGIEAMYNYEYKYNGDDFSFTDTDFYIYSTTGKSRLLKGGYNRFAYQGRLFLNPKPTVQTSDKIELKEVQWLTYPEDVAGLALLTVRYQDTAKGDDGWMYIPSIRRVRRISVAQRGDSFGGTDLTWDDYRGFSGKVSDYTWKLMGKKDLIVPYHAVTWKMRHKDRVPISEDVRYELRQLVVVEGVNKLKDYVYSKRIVYLDADSWFISAEDLYDRRGALWKYIEIPWSFDQRNHNMFAYGYCAYDLIGKRSTVITIRDKQDGPLQVLNTGLKEEDFSPSVIQTWGR
jgi:hypothetical protein